MNLLLFNISFFISGAYILPTNGKYVGTNFELLPKDPTKPADQFVPKLDGNPGLNYFDSIEKYLYVVVKGPEFIEIRQTNVIQVFNMTFLSILQILSIFLYSFGLI